MRIDVLQTGEKVILQDGLEAEVISALITNQSVQYQCVWWDGRTRKTEWVNSWEVREVPATPARTSAS